MMCMGNMYYEDGGGRVLVLVLVCFIIDCTVRKVVTMILLVMCIMFSIV